MSLRLSKHEMGWFRRGQIAEGGEVFQYRVGGLPPGEEAFIAEYPHKGWEILRSSDGIQGEWHGCYATADAALKALEQEMNLG